ncbi:MAG: sulfite exporter TauE/SafE family protein [Hyphomicrobium sp.]
MESLLASPWAVIVGGGFIIGFLIGITGVGAGSLTTPLLIWVGYSPAVAVGTDLLFASLTKASAAWRHHRLGNVNWGILGWLALGSIPGAALMLGWLYHAQHQEALDMTVLASAIKQVLAGTLVLSSLAILISVWLKGHRPPEHEAATDVPARRWPTLIFGVVLGAMVALTSVGAGAIGVAVLTGLYPMLLARRVVGTDIVHAIPLTFVSGLGHAGMGNIDLTLLATLLAGSVPGILIGSRVTGLIPDWLLRVALSIILLWAAYVIFHK